jgi:hypothetical protein
VYAYAGPDSKPNNVIIALRRSAAGLVHKKARAPNANVTAALESGRRPNPSPRDRRVLTPVTRARQCLRRGVGSRLTILVHSEVSKAAGRGPRHHGHASFEQRCPGPWQSSWGHGRSGCASQIQPSAQWQFTRVIVCDPASAEYHRSEHDRPRDKILLVPSARDVAAVLGSPPVQVLQRPDWHGSPVNLGELFILHKNRRQATCQLHSHQFGWELRLVIGSQLEVVQTQVCRTEDEVLTTGEQWRAKLLEEGWA